MSIYLDEFETLYGISNNIENLRSKILELAFKGKLVSQEKIDKSVFKLVNKMEKEKPKKFKNKNEEFPYKVPENWIWMKHSQLYDISGGSQPPKSEFIYEPQEGYIRLYQTRDYGDNPQPAYIPVEDARKKSEEGEILLARYGGSLGKVFKAKKGAYNVALVKVELLYDFDYINNDFLFYFYKSNLYQKFTNNQSRSAQSGFNKSDFNSLNFPLPPLEEQKRIVAKIEKLMKEVNKLESKLEEKEQVSQNLSESIVEAIKNSQNAEELKENLKFIIDNFDVIFKTSESMDEMRSIVLQLAIEGKLVPQNENDEPTSELIKKIKKARKNLKEEGKLKKPRGKIYNIEKTPFAIPNSWKWLRLGITSNIVMGQSPKGNTVSEDPNNGIEFHQGKSYYGKKILENSFKFTSDPKKISYSDSIIISVRAPVGALNYNNRKICIGRGLASIKPHEQIDIDYLYYSILTQVEKLKEKSKGSTFKAITAKILMNLKIPIPPHREQKRIVKKVDSIMEIIDKLEIELEKKEDLVEKLGAI